MKKELKRKSIIVRSKRQDNRLINNDLIKSQVIPLSSFHPDPQDNILTQKSYSFFKVTRQRHLDINQVLREYFNAIDDKLTTLNNA